MDVHQGAFGSIFLQKDTFIEMDGSLQSYPVLIHARLL